jgi:hypothetical protein
MIKRFKKIINIFASQQKNEKKSFASEDEKVFIKINKRLFEQALDGLAKKDKAEIPTITV